MTEFSWDSNPPDPKGVPAVLEGRWVAEALYRMWSAGVSLVTWFTLRDQPVRPIRNARRYSTAWIRGSQVFGIRTSTTRPAATVQSFPQREIEMVAEKMEAAWAELMPLTYAAFNANGRVSP